jgi:putative glutathione S-transferase
VASGGQDYYPAASRRDIDEINAYVYGNVNNGVYRCGFAGKQAATRLRRGGCSMPSTSWKIAFPVRAIWSAMRRPKQTGGSSRPWCGSMRCTTGISSANLRRIEDYPNLSGYLRDLFQTPGIVDTVNFDHIRRHYYMSHEHINPSRIVPLGPVLDFMRPHGRGALGTAR